MALRAVYWVVQRRGKRKNWLVDCNSHHAKDCCKKAKDCAAQSNGGTAPKVTTAPNQLTPDELAKLIQESMGSLEEDAKLSIIENLMPKDFVQGPN